MEDGGRGTESRLLKEVGEVKQSVLELDNELGTVLLYSGPRLLQ